MQSSFEYEGVLKFCKVLSKKKKEKTPLKWYIILALLNANRFFFFFKGLALVFRAIDNRDGEERKLGVTQRIYYK